MKGSACATGPSRSAEGSLQLFEMGDVFLDRTACQVGNAQVLAVCPDHQIVCLDGEELLMALEIGRDIGRVRWSTSSKLGVPFIFSSGESTGASPTVRPYHYTQDRSTRASRQTGK